MDAEILRKIHKNNYLTKGELLNQLKNKGIKIPSRTLTYCIDLGLIPKSNKTFIRGIAGSVSYFEENTLLMITGIKLLTEYYGYQLKEISKYKNLVYDFNESEIYKIVTKPKNNKDEYAILRYERELTKFENIITTYGCFELGHKPGLKIMMIDHKPYMPTIKYYTNKENRITEIAVKIQYSEAIPGKKTAVLENLKFYKAVVFSKNGIEIIS